MMESNNPGLARPVRILLKPLVNDAMDWSIFISLFFLISLMLVIIPPQKIRIFYEAKTKVPSSSPMTTRLSAPCLKIENTVMGNFWSLQSANAVASMMPKLPCMASSKLILL
jgi:hypothetical protein